jgi:hypothetical protein
VHWPKPNKVTGQCPTTVTYFRPGPDRRSLRTRRLGPGRSLLSAPRRAAASSYRHCRPLAEPPTCTAVSAVTPLRLFLFVASGKRGGEKARFANSGGKLKPAYHHRRQNPPLSPHPRANYSSLIPHRQWRRRARRRQGKGRNPPLSPLPLADYSSRIPLWQWRRSAPRRRGRGRNPPLLSHP